MQLEWSGLSIGETMQRFGHFMLSLGHVLDDVGHGGTSLPSWHGAGDKKLDVQAMQQPLKTPLGPMQMQKSSKSNRV